MTQLLTEQLAAMSSLGDAAQTVNAAISTASKCLRLAVGHYRVEILDAETAAGSTPAARRVYLQTGADDTTTVAAPANTADKADASAATAGIRNFRGDMVETIEVTNDKPYVAFILSAGATATVITFTRLRDA